MFCLECSNDRIIRETNEWWTLLGWRSCSIFISLNALFTLLKHHVMLSTIKPEYCMYATLLLKRHGYYRQQGKELTWWLHWAESWAVASQECQVTTSTDRTGPVVCKRGSTAGDESKDHTAVRIIKGATKNNCFHQVWRKCVFKCVDKTTKLLLVQ